MESAKTSFDGSTNSSPSHINSCKNNVISIDTQMIYYIRKNLAVSGYFGISMIDNFLSHHFDVHLQCATGFEGWISDHVSVKSIPFDDCKEIDGDVFRSATNWLMDAWRRGKKILISCFAGESRSVSIAIGFLILSERLSFEDACKEVFAANPRSYPHPQTLLSVAGHCGVELDFFQLKSIYDSKTIPPPFPWSDEELKSALKHAVTNKRCAASTGLLPACEEIAGCRIITR